MTRESSPPEAPAGDAARRGSGVGGEQDLDVVDAVSREPHPLAVGQRDTVGVGASAQLDVDDGLAHGQVRELLRDAGAEVVTGRPRRASDSASGGRDERRTRAGPPRRRAARRGRRRSRARRAVPRRGPTSSSTSSTVSPYLRVSTPSAARRSCT